MHNKQITQEELSGFMKESLSVIDRVLLEATSNCPAILINYDDKTLAAATHIFFDAIISRMWQHQEFLSMPFEQRCVMAEKCGKGLRKFVKKFTGVDTHEINKNR